MLSLELHKRRFLESWEAEQGKRAQDLTQPGSEEDTVWGTFEKIQIIGTGAFGAVVLCKKKQMPDRDKVSFISIKRRPNGSVNRSDEILSGIILYCYFRVKILLNICPSFE